jgi:hypothetical protein
MLKRCKSTFVGSLKNSITDAYKMKNIPRLNDITNFLIDLIQENQVFRINNRHLENQPIFQELDSLVNLYSNCLHLIAKLEFRK